MERLFVDTSAWFAFLNRNDSSHEAVREVLREFQGQLLTSDYIFDETVTLCRYRLGFILAGTVGNTLLDPSVVQMVRVTPEDQEAAWKLFVARPDKAYSFTDCTSFILMRRLGLPRALALDADFRQEGFESVPV